MAQTEETATGQPSEPTPPPETAQESKPEEAKPTPESAADEVVEPEEEKTPLAELVMAGGEAVKHLQRAKHLNPQMLRDFLANDTYPLLMEFMSAVDWYVMDLHNRVIALEGGEEDEDEGDEYMDPQFAAGVLEYVGRFLQISKKLLEWAEQNKDAEVHGNLQLLVAASPGIMMHIQQVMAEQEADEDEEEEDESDEGDEDDGAYGEAEREGDAENVVEPEQAAPSGERAAPSGEQEKSDG
jgi:hypothetical protein